MPESCCFVGCIPIEGIKDLEKGSLGFQQIQFSDRDGLLPLIVNTGCQPYILESAVIILTQVSCAFAQYFSYSFVSHIMF